MDEPEIKIGEYYLTDYAGGQYCQVTDIVKGRKKDVVVWRSAFGGRIRKINRLALLLRYYYTNSQTKEAFISRML